MKNKVTYIGHYGGDKAVARAAWTSTNIEVDLKSDEEIGELLDKRLWNNSSGHPHKTPFERAIIEFTINCDQASHIHTLKHRLANINGESARYKELKEDKTYLPEDWLNYGSVGEKWYKLLNSHSDLGNQLYHDAIKELVSAGMPRKRAKESARFFKTMNSQLTLSVMMNMSCFYNFISLRGDADAQLEIREIANECVQMLKDIEGNPFKNIIKAFKW